VRIVKRKLRKIFPTAELGRDWFFFRDRPRIATGILFWFATGHGPRPEFFSGSRPVVGRDPQENSGRDLDPVVVPNNKVDFH
jgi:hypothetical protein